MDHYFPFNRVLVGVAISMAVLLFFRQHPYYHALFGPPHSGSLFAAQKAFEPDGRVPGIREWVGKADRYRTLTLTGQTGLSRMASAQVEQCRHNC